MEMKNGKERIIEKGKFKVGGVLVDQNLFFVGANSYVSKFFTVIYSLLCWNINGVKQKFENEDTQKLFSTHDTIVIPMILLSSWKVIL